VLSLGRDALLLVWLSILGFASGGILRSRLRCSEGGFGLWLGDEGIVVVKRAHNLLYSNSMMEMLSRTWVMLTYQL
jgi:hypothetical protein